MDQHNSYYLTPTKSNKWLTRIYTSLLSCALCNSRIMYNEMNPGTPMPLLDYQKLFLRELLQYTIRRNPTPSYVLSPTRVPAQHTPVRIVPARPLSAAQWRDTTNIRLRGLHFPGLLPNNNGRTACVICGIRTQFVCGVACGGHVSCAFLCLRGDIENSCWYRHHDVDFSRK